MSRIFSKIWSSGSRTGAKQLGPLSDEQAASPSLFVRFSYLLWNLGHVLGLVAGAMVALAVAIVIFGQSWQIREGIDAVLPDRWFKWLSRPDLADDVERLRIEAAQHLKKSGEGTQKKPVTFGLGSTKDDVLAVQGKSDQRGENTWRYGESEVYFVGDRVVGWRVSASAPLRAR